MSNQWKLKRTKQCAKCPWRVDVDPHDIPNGYDTEKHKNLSCTIAEPGVLQNNSHAMSCHEHDPEEETHCVGWLVNQLGPGNNIPLRIRLISCENAKDIEIIGEQHQTFEETLP